MFLAIPKARVTEYRPTLSWFERNRCFLTAVSTRSLRFRTQFGLPTIPFHLASFAALRSILEALLCKELLFIGCEHELGSAFSANQDLVNISHG